MARRSCANVRDLLRTALLVIAIAGPSVLADDVINTASVSFIGTSGPVTLPTNVVRARKIDPVPLGGTLFVQKTASRDVAEIGDFVDFTVRVRNVSNFTISQVLVEDGLPFGFTYERGSTQVAGARMPDPPGNPGPRLTFVIGDLGAGRTIDLTYRTRVGV